MNESFPQHGGRGGPTGADDGAAGDADEHELAEGERDEDEAGLDDAAAARGPGPPRSSEPRATEPAFSAEELETRLGLLPARPGCYIFRDRRGEVLYVGKAKSLRSRVRSYFQA